MIDSSKQQNEKIKIQFVLELAKMLHESGLPSHRLEFTLEKLCQNISLKGDFFVSIGSIFASLEYNGKFESHLIKIKSSDLNLERMNVLEKLIQDVSHSKIDLENAMNQLNQIQKQKELYSSWIMVLFFAISTGSAACVFGGKFPEILASFSIGLGIGTLISMLSIFPKMAKVVVILASIWSVIVATIFQSFFLDFQKEIATICGLIILIPGFSFTVSITEMVNNHFISGLSRFTAAFITFSMIAIGIIVGTKMMAQVSIPINYSDKIPFPFWIKGIALLFVPLGFVILFKAKIKDFFWITLACWISYFSYSISSEYLPAAFAVFLSSFILGIASNSFAKFKKRNESLMLVPGMILLVPGSLGFLSITSLIESNVLEGISTSLLMLGTSLALVFGLLFSNLFFSKN